MADPVEFSTFYNPNFEGVLVINKNTVETLVELLEVAGHQVTWNNVLSPDYYEE